MATLAELRKKHSGKTPKIILSSGDIRRRSQTAQQTRGNQFDQTRDRSFLQKARDFSTKIIGGGKTSEGAGLALASGGIQKSQDEQRLLRKQQIDQLITTIREKRQRGESVAKEIELLKDISTQSQIATDQSTDFIETLPTTKEVIGSSARLATTLASGAITRSASKAFALGKASTFAGGTVRGAGVGASSGAVIGGLQGAGLGLEANKDTEGVLQSTALGAGTGAVLGGALGAVTGGITGVVQGKRQASENFAKELVSPKPTQKVKAQAIREGRINDASFFRKATIQASKRDDDLADAVGDVVSRKATVGQNIDGIRLKINNTDDAVESYVRNNKVPFNTNQLKSRLNSGKEQLDLIFASDSSAEKTYDAVVKAFLKQVGKKDTSGLLKARKSFDQLPAVKKLLESDKLGENARREIVLTVRSQANKYVASLLPKGNTFRDNLLKEHFMLEALTNISEKTAREIGKNKLQLLTQEYPILKWLAAGLAGAGGVGIGGSIIGSTD